MLIRSVQKAVRIVSVVSADPAGLTASEIAERAGLPVPTAHHLLGTLVAEGMLGRNGRRYSLGPMALSLAAAVRPGEPPPPSLHLPLQQLAATTEETAYLSSWQNGAAVVIATIEGRHAVRVARLEEGYGAYSHARATGKVLLAFGSPDSLSSYCAEVDLGGPTANAIASEEELLKHLEIVREQGVAFDRQEFSTDAIGVAAPILCDGIAVGAYAVTAPAERFRQNEEAYTEAVRVAAAEAGSKAAA